MTEAPLVVRGVAALDRSQGPLAVSIGVFDGLHLGHAHLLAALVEHSRAWKARPAVITFDAHPDAVLRGEAPPLLLDLGDRERLLAAAGIEVTVVEHFDERLRMTPYDEFVARIAARVEIAGFVMTPDAAFGHERRGTPDALRALAAAGPLSFHVAVVPPFSVDGRPVSSSQVRRLVTTGDLVGAERLLGRQYAAVGAYDLGSGALSFALPVALPPPGEYRVAIGSQRAVARIDRGGSVVLDGLPAVASAERLRLVFEAQSAVSASTGGAPSEPPGGSWDGPSDR
jgi:FAD synthetase